MLKKIIRGFVVIYAIITLTMLVAWSVRIVMINGKLFPDKLSNFIMGFASFPSNIYHTLFPNTVPYDIFDQRLITDSVSANGITLYARKSSFASTNLLISTLKSKDQVEFKIISVPNGKEVKSWQIPLQYEQEFMKKDFKLRFAHPLMFNDSTILIKEPTVPCMLALSKNNQIKWIDTNYIFHHSIEIQDDSTIWVPSIAKDFKHYLIPDFKHSAICAIDPRNGKIKFIKSVADILVENGYVDLLNLGYENDGLHLNDIQPALSSSKYWEKGDLMISLRHRNTVLIYRPKTNKIIWLKTGPWLAQHDCDFIDNKTIMVFGNDILRQKNDSLINGHNEIYFYDFEKDKITKPYNKVMRQLAIKTKAEGRCDLLANGDLFIDESNLGKLYIINKDGLKMTYAERYDKNHVKMLNWVRPF